MLCEPLLMKETGKTFVIFFRVSLVFLYTGGKRQVSDPQFPVLQGINQPEKFLTCLLDQVSSFWSPSRFNSSLL
uniref:Uncharacterized protein n=1 Tax=Utricularia reniformis TaxID=192314 RepID=A0A1Y0B2F9_9LAMI|nr:hypothetical protein AEK19_MT1341 [Utricularia reniformis]ART31539.1 hypothetical protein AEK19_MT1341 [Utricularia reniformis]